MPGCCGQRQGAVTNKTELHNQHFQTGKLPHSGLAAYPSCRRPPLAVQ